MELKREVQENQKYTYADYATWDDGQRWEIINGQPIMMSPAPTIQHQRLCGELFSLLHSFLKGKQCEAFIAPVDVRFENSQKADTVVQPDVLVICDKTKIKNEGCVGAPDVVFEILSPSSAKMDLLKKYNLYEKHGVREYWALDPEDKMLVRFSLKDGRFERSNAEQGRLESLALPGFALDVQELFAVLDDTPAE